MNRRDFLRGTLAAAAAAPLTRLPAAKWLRRGDTAAGYVFHDRDGSGVRKPSSRGLAGVCVSNGRDVVRTDANGRWELPVLSSMEIFVIKPRGWSSPMGERALPEFYYAHREQASPSDFKFKGLPASGGLPATLDFPLRPQKEDSHFSMILFGDPQPRNQTEIDYIAHDVVECAAREAKEIGAKFGLSLGDQMFDDLSLYDSLNGVISTLGIPWYSTVGNHDLNYDAMDNGLANETFNRVYGPSTYAFNYGQVHFVVLNNVMWHGKGAPGYHAELTPDVLAFLRNDLAFVPKDQLVVIAMHIPLPEIKNKDEFFRALEGRPHTFSLSAHTHVQSHAFMGPEDGWHGTSPHHHLNHATVCGSWWEGAPDERGIPHATMADGGPNGYSVVTFSGSQYSVGFRPASRPREEQMNIWLPEEIPAAEASGHEVIVNVFAGSARSTAEMRVGSGDWHPLRRFEGQDPYFLALKEAEASPKPPTGLKLPRAATTPHLWRGVLPSNMEAGTHSLEVRTRDMFGKTHESRRILRVV